LTAVYDDESLPAMKSCARKRRSGHREALAASRS
jgi:hypothetical protein